MSLLDLPKDVFIHFRFSPLDRARLMRTNKHLYKLIKENYPIHDSFKYCVESKFKHYVPEHAIGFYIRSGLIVDYIMCLSIIYDGDVDMLEWCKQKGANKYKRALEMAVYYGDVSEAEWCLGNISVTILGDNYLEKLVQMDRLEMIKWLCFTIAFDYEDVVMVLSCNYHKLEIFKWCLSLVEPTGEVIRHCIRYNLIDFMELMITKISITQQEMDLVCNDQMLELIKNKKRKKRE